MFNELFGEAVSLLEGNMTDDAVVLIKTAAGNIYHQTLRSVGMVRCDGLPQEPSDYEANVNTFLDMLREKNDIRVQYILTVINGNVVRLTCNDRLSVELPPYCIRRGLLDLDPNNSEVVILLNNSHSMKLSESMPPPK